MSWIIWSMGGRRWNGRTVEGCKGRTARQPCGFPAPYSQRAAWIVLIMSVLGRAGLPAPALQGSTVSSPSFWPPSVLPQTVRPRLWCVRPCVRPRSVERLTADGHSNALALPAIVRMRRCDLRASRRPSPRAIACSRSCAAGGDLWPDRASPEYAFAWARPPRAHVPRFPRPACVPPDRSVRCSGLAFCSRSAWEVPSGRARRAMAPSLMVYGGPAQSVQS